MTPERFSKIIRLAEIEAQKTLQTLGVAQQQLQQQQLGLQRLLQFRLDYRAQMKAQGANGIAAYNLQDLEVFLRRLDLAVVEQEEKVRVAEQNAIRAQQLWQACHQRVLSLEKALLRLKQQLLRQAGRAEQREIDEWVLAKRQVSSPPDLPI